MYVVCTHEPHHTYINLRECVVAAVLHYNLKDQVWVGVTAVHRDPQFTMPVENSCFSDRLFVVDRHLVEVYSALTSDGSEYVL